MVSASSLAGMPGPRWSSAASHTLHPSISRLTFSRCGCGTSRTSKTYLKASGKASGSTNLRMPIPEPPATNHKCGRTYPRNRNTGVLGTNLASSPRLPCRGSVEGTGGSNFADVKPAGWSGSSDADSLAGSEHSGAFGALADNDSDFFGINETYQAVKNGERSPDGNQALRG